MQNPVRTLFLVLLGITLLAGMVQGQDTDELFISETSDAADDFNTEFMEIYNNSDQDIDLASENVKIAQYQGQPSSSAETVFDFGTDETGDCESTVVPAGGALIVARGASKSDFETEWGTFPDMHANYCPMSSAFYIGTDNRSYELLIGGTTNTNDGTVTDDTPEFPQEKRRYQDLENSSGPWITGDDVSSANPGVLNSNQVLPVELAKFVVRANDDRGQLTWKTASETNNAGFAVQHRAPGADGWTERGFVEGAGTTTEAQSYTFTTEALGSGTHTFRLKQVDTDGSTHYSDPETISIQAETGLTVSGPNPLGPGQTAALRVAVGSEQKVTVALYDVLGQQVRTLVTERAAPGRPLRTTLSTDGLASGVYFLRQRSLRPVHGED